MKKIRLFTIAEIISFLGLSVDDCYYAYRAFYICDPQFESALFSKIMVVFSLLVVVFGICNLCSAIGVLGKLNCNGVQKTIWRSAVVMKIVFIPMFLINFIFGVIFGLFAMFFVVTLPYVLLIVGAAWFAMMASSGYCIALILQAKKQGIISTKTMIIQIMLQMIFILDVVGLVFLRRIVYQLQTGENR